MSITVMKQALEALEHMCHHTRAKVGYKGQIVGDAMESLRQAITTEESSATQEPVAWMVGDNQWVYFELNRAKAEARVHGGEIKPLYQYPQPKAEQEPKREPLTDEQLREIENKINPNMRWRSSDEEGITLYPSEYYDLVRAIEAAHGIKE